MSSPQVLWGNCPLVSNSSFSPHWPDDEQWGSSVSSTMRTTKFITVLNQMVSPGWYGWSARVSGACPELWVTNWRKRGKPPEGRTILPTAGRKDYFAGQRIFSASDYRQVGQGINISKISISNYGGFWRRLLNVTGLPIPKSCCHASPWW